MSVLKGNISSVLRRADNTLLDKYAAGNKRDADLRAAQVANAKASLTQVGASADADTQLLLAQQDTKEGVQDVLANQLGMFANKGVAAQTASAREKLLADRETTALNNFKTELGNKDLLEGFQNKQQIKDELKELGQYQPGTPQYKEALEKHHQFNITNAVPDKQITDIYSQQFATADIQIRPETIQAAIGAGVDPTNPDSFTTNAYNTAVKTISDRLQGQWTGIQDKSVFDAKAKDLLSKSQWGQNFDRQTTLEAGQTTQEVRLKDYAGKITQSINLAAQTGDQTGVDRNINELLTFARKNNITGEALAPFNEFINIALERTVSDPVALFNEVNPQSEFTTSDGRTPYITPVQANKLKNKLTERYREKFPNLSDASLTARIKQDFKKDGNLAFAIQRGEDLAKFRSKGVADEMKQSAAFKSGQTGVLLAMRRDGRKGYIKDQLVAKLGKFMDPDGDDYRKIIKQSSKVIDRFKQIFSQKGGPNDGQFLLQDTEAEEAFNLAINRAILGQGALRNDFFTPSDLVMGTSSQDAEKLTDRELLKLFLEGLPKASASVSNLDLGSNQPLNVTKGIKDLRAFAKNAQQEVNEQGTLSNWQWWEKAKDLDLELSLNSGREIDNRVLGGIVQKGVKNLKQALQ